MAPCKNCRDALFSSGAVVMIRPIKGNCVKNITVNLIINVMTIFTVTSTKSLFTQINITQSGPIKTADMSSQHFEKVKKVKIFECCSSREGWMNHGKHNEHHTGGATDVISDLESCDHCDACCSRWVSSVWDVVLCEMIWSVLLWCASIWLQQQVLH